MPDREEKHSILPLRQTADSKEHGIFAALEALKDLNSSKSTLRELSKQIAVRTRSALKACCVSLWLADNQDKFINLQAFSCIDSTDTDPKKFNLSLAEPSPVADCLRKGKPGIHKKQSLAEIDPRAAILTKTYISIVLPLLSFGKTIGVFEILTASNNPVNKPELEVLGVLTGQIALLLTTHQNIGQMAKQSELQKRFYEITAKINQAKDVESILKITVEELGTVLNLPGASIHLNMAAASGIEGTKSSSEMEAGS